MRVRVLPVAVAGLGLLSLVACGAPRTAGIQLAAASAPASGSSPAAPSAASTSPATGQRCDASPWTGRYDPNGAPAFRAGDAGAVYIWHDDGGWHLRATDVRPTDHHYSGTIQVGPAAANVTGLRTVRDERDDRVWIDGTNTIHYDLHTHASVDGFDFTLSCRDAGHERELLGFRALFDQQPVPDRVRIGENRVIPTSAEFAFRRAT